MIATDERSHHTGLISPHGGTLVDLLAVPERRAELKVHSAHWPSWDLTPRQLCDLELLLSGGFSPLRGFLSRADYEGVLDRMRLTDGMLWPMPVTLDIPDAIVNQLDSDPHLVLRDSEGLMLAALHVTDVWKPDVVAEAEATFATGDRGHPGVDHLLGATHPWYVTGVLEGLQLPQHYDYRELRRTPGDLRSELQGAGWCDVVAFQTRNPLHRAHLELTVRAAREVGANLLVHPVVGMTKPGDVDHYTRVRCYQAVMASYPPGLARLALLPLAMRMGGPREAIWHAIIRKNYGANRLIVGRDHAGPGVDANGRPYYGPYDAQDALRRHQEEIGVTMAPFSQMVYLEGRDEYVTEDEVARGAKTLSISGTELRRRLNLGSELPAWFTPPAVAEQLRRTYPPRSRQGFAVFFTGLSGAGKSTIANVLLVKLLELGGRRVTLLDGDVVRKHLSSELGFSKEHRNVNIRRIGFVAAEVAKHGGVAICAPIAPYDAARRSVRGLVEAAGGFILVFVSTPLDVCEARDRKGLYARARAGSLKEFTGISDPYEAPADAELVIDTTDLGPEAAAGQILSYLQAEGFLAQAVS